MRVPIPDQSGVSLVGCGEMAGAADARSEGVHHRENRECAAGGWGLASGFTCVDLARLEFPFTGKDVGTIRLDAAQIAKRWICYGPDGVCARAGRRTSRERTFETRDGLVGTQPKQWRPMARLLSEQT